MGVLRKRVLFAGSDRVDETDSVLVPILLLFASRSQKRGVFFLSYCLSVYPPYESQTKYGQPDNQVYVQQNSVRQTIRTGYQ